ncbi:pathogenesis-related protein PRB1-3 [Diospyros lotus]|uniref:pathogenesis-related protein PRB1-3 n=1 Tax=Diospyros lotus TaxID=55363 RepID=UPI00224F1349|nr:pathogenesis-related protein PRB1-3 [Diospyros lotus]
MEAIISSVTLLLLLAPPSSSALEEALPGPGQLLSSRRRSLTSSTVPSNIIQQYLLPHNRLRAEVGLPPLQWSESLARFAARWALQRRGDCELIHSDSDYGENLFWGSGRDWQPGDAVAAWAAEKSYYNYESNSCTGKKDCWHYTQMVWRQSRRVGCAKVTCRSGDTLIGCNYFPHGNVIGQKPF